MTTTHPIIAVENVSFKYQAEEVIEDISLKIYPGDFLGLIGPNGSGKTTLLKIMVGLLEPSKGKIQLFGVPLQKFRQWQKIGYVPQKAALSLQHVPLTAAETVGLAGGDHRAIKSALKAVDMSEHQDQLLSQLSGGQQQRVLIARALVNRPSLLILDEPTVGIDTQSQANFYQLLKRLNQIHQLTLILVSHDVSVVAHEVNTIACINKKLVYHGKPESLLKQKNLSDIFGPNLKLVNHDH